MRNTSIDILVNYRWILASFLLLATAVLAFFVVGVTRDPSMRSGIVPWKSTEEEKEAFSFADACSTVSSVRR
jgi:hypothetical protein